MIDWHRPLLPLFVSILCLTPTDPDCDSEMSFHAELAVKRNSLNSMSPARARHNTLGELADTQQYAGLPASSASGDSIIGLHYGGLEP